MLTQKKIDIATMILAGETQQEICEATGLSRSSVQRLYKDPEIMGEVDRQRVEAQAAVDRSIQRRADILQASLSTHIKLVNTLLSKLLERVEDLPAEAFQPNMIAPLLNACTSANNSAVGHLQAEQEQEQGEEKRGLTPETVARITREIYGI